VSLIAFLSLALAAVGVVALVVTLFLRSPRCDYGCGRMLWKSSYTNDDGEWVRVFACSHCNARKVKIIKMR